MIELQDVAKSWDAGRSWAVDGVSLTVETGKVLALLGGSGSGKSTTVKMINRLIEPSRGRVLIDGADVLNEDPVQLRRRIGYVFQGIGLFPHLTVGENIGAVPRLLGWSPAKIAARVDELLELVHLPPETYRGRSPAAMSGGQRQRVGFARALAASPRVMLLDEPFGALDPVTRDSLQSEFKMLQQAMGLTAVIVTHDMAEAMLLADRIAVMRDGRLLRVGSPAELMRDPGDPFVASLVETPRRHAEFINGLCEEIGS